MRRCKDGLCCRSVDNTKMSQFFKNNFTEERWRKAALKNAFVLLGKQKFHHAAAFFLLGGAVRDAVEVFCASAHVSFVSFMTLYRHFFFQLAFCILIYSEAI